MVRVNKTPLTTKQTDDLFRQLAKVIAPKNSDHANDVLSEILGREEKLMLAKRIAIIILLHENVSHYKIAHTLKLSITTISKVAEKKSNGVYKIILDTITNNSRAYTNILEALDAILTLSDVLPKYGQTRLTTTGLTNK